MEDEQSKNFEKRVHKSMKASGMLFPKTEEEVESFERKFLTRPTSTPELTADQLLELVTRRFSEPLIKLAAFKPKPDNK